MLCFLDDAHAPLPTLPRLRGRVGRGIFALPHFLVAGKSFGASGLDPPTKSNRPSENVISRPFALKAPSFARKPFTMITVPAAKESFVNPALTNTPGGPASTAQFSTFLSGFTTAM